MDRLRRVDFFSGLLGQWRHYPGTLSFLGLLWLVGALSSSIRSGPTEALRDVIGLRLHSLPDHPASLVTSAFWADAVASYVLFTVLVLVLGAAFERRLGSLTFILVALGTQVGAALLSLGIAHGVTLVGGNWSDVLTSAHSLGPAAIVFGVAATGAATLETLWRRRLRLGLFAFAGLLALYGGSFQDLINLMAVIIGSLLGPLVTKKALRTSRVVVSAREARVLVALIVAVGALGPVIAALNTHAVGPLAVLKYLYTEVQPLDVPTVQGLCADPAQAQDCSAATLQLRAGFGSIFMAVLPSFMLLVLADGLRRGRRFAWWAAVSVQVSSTVFAILDALPVIIGTPSVGGANPYESGYLHGALGLLLPMAVPVAIIVLLLLTRGRFSARAPSGTYPRIFGATGVLFIGLSITYCVLGSVFTSGFSPTPSFLDFVLDSPDRFLALRQLLEVPPGFTPQGPGAVILYESIGVLFWIIVAIYLLKSFVCPAHSRADHDEDDAKKILQRHGGGTMGWMTTWPGNTYWFSADRESFVAFRVISGIALTLGPPAGPAHGLCSAISGFADHCATNGWIPCFYSVAEPTRTHTAQLGWGSVQVAEETLLPLGNIAFTGKKFQDIRTALNRAAKEGISAEWVRYGTAPLSVVGQINAISEEWVADKDLPEMGFTLGSIDQVDDPEVRCLIAIDDHHVVHAVTSWLPIYENGEITGWTLDFMRRRTEGFRASTEFLIASAALSLEREGYQLISLSGAPLARLEKSGIDVPAGHVNQDNMWTTAILDRLLHGLGASLEPVYGFRSLLAFKAKFQPNYVPLFMTFPDAAALPSIGNALSRAYLPTVTFNQGFALLQSILRRGK
ncbi:DUF2156 domain-containing protein [Pseudarthrobacter sp. PS3-L1]|uniref:bifunctional lysylphosphatidylglycerol flippase/synthetase MprF n=1 Tax=Pseudarthrobacter sp. PS3-L1 TaxID=3046207 RepID=UPI0032D8CD8D